MITTVINNDEISQIKWLSKVHQLPAIISFQNQHISINHNFLINCDKNPEPILLYYSKKYLFLCKAAQYRVLGVYNIISKELIIADVVYENHFKSVIENFIRLTEKYSSEFNLHINSTPKKVCTFVGTRQIMHHFMQELPGVQKLVNEIDIQKIYSFFEYYGPHDFVLNTNTPIVYVENIEQLFVSTCVEKISFYKLILSHTTPEILSRVKDFAYRISEPSTSTFNKCFLFTIRTTKRLLTNQEEFIINSIQMLEEVYPGSLYYIDGYTKLHNSWVEDTHPHVQGERKIFSNIQKALPNINIKSLIFIDLVTYINSVRYVDFYVSHIGTLQHKIGFFSNARGLIHGGADKLIGDWQDLWYNASHFGKTVQRFSDECIVYENNTYNSSYKLKIKECMLFLRGYLEKIEF